MTNSELFKFTFFEQALDQKLTPQEMLSRVKEAVDLVESLPEDDCAELIKEAGIFSSLLAAGGSGLATMGSAGLGALADTAKLIGSGLLSWGVPIALVAPPIAGAALGATVASASDVDNMTPNEYLKEDLINTLDEETQQLIRNKAINEYNKTINNTVGRRLY